MSTLSTTPDDKMQRYLQRIQKLVGHRAKSPILMKSRNKSPINVKSSRIDIYHKHQVFIKSITSVYNENQRKNKTHFFYNFVDNYQVRETKRRDSNFSQQNCRKTVKKQNDQPLAVRFIVKALQQSITDLLRQSFDSIKANQSLFSAKQQQFVSRDIKRPLKHRRTYSEIYAQSISKYQSKSPKTSQNYQYKTPSVQKKESLLNLKKVQTRLIVTVLQKIHLRYKQNLFSQIKSFYCMSLSLDMNQARHYLAQIEEKFIALKKQQEKTTQQLKKANQTIVEQQKAYQMTSYNLDKIKQQSISRNEDDAMLEVSEMQRILHQTKAIMTIYEILNKKNLFNLSFAIDKIRKSRLTSIYLYTKCLALSNTLKSLRNVRRNIFLVSLVQYVQKVRVNQKSQKSLVKTQSRQVIMQRVKTPTQISQQTARIQSMQSSKHSRSSQKSSASTFDLFAKKVNSAFELKSTLRQIYSLGFQKIDKASFIYLTISNPINTVIRTTTKQSFRKILFYSFYKSQQKQKSSVERKPSFIVNAPPKVIQPKPVHKNYEKMFNILKKLQRKIIFMKIQAYSVLKLNSELKQSYTIPQDVVISQVDLKKQIKDFLQQRNKMHKKTYDTWQKTKEMLQQVKHSQSRSSINSRIKT